MQTPQTKLLLSASILLAACNPTLRSTVEGHGFTYLQTPRTTIGPGTLVRLDDPVTPICWSDQAFPGLPEPRVSETSTTEIKSSFDATFDADAEQLDRIRGNARFSTVESIELSIRNAVVLENSFADFYKYLPARDAACKKAEDDEKKAGRDVYTVLQALRANIVYTVTTKTEVSAGASTPGELFEGLKVELGGSVVNEKEQTIEGAGLYFGLVVAKFGETSGSEPGQKLTEDERRKLVRGPVYIIGDKSVADLIKAGNR